MVNVFATSKLETTRGLDHNVIENKDGSIICKKMTFGLRKFKASVGTKEQYTNYLLQAGTMFIDGIPVIRIVDEAARFFAASFLLEQSFRECWKTIQCVSLFYLGTPDYFVIDQRSPYTLKQMKELVRRFGVNLGKALIETPGAITVVEIYRVAL